MLYPGKSTEDETLFFQEVTESWNEMNGICTKSRIMLPRYTAQWNQVHITSWT